MGVIVNKNQEEENELSRQINADLRARQVAEEQTPDFAEDAEYVKNTKKTGKFAWIWVILVLLAIASLIVIAVGV